jgi:nucleoside-diphosphate-sugar epimerase
MIPYTEQEAQAVMTICKGIARRVVALSSMDVYQAYGGFTRLEAGVPAVEPFAEDAPLRTQLYPYRAQAQSVHDFVYHYEKILVECVVMNDDRLRGTVLRLPQVYGPGDPQRRLGGYVRRIVEGRPAILLEAGQAQWRWTRGYVENVAAAIALAASDERAAGRIYNVGEATALTESEWVCRIAEVVGWPGRVIAAPREMLPEPLRLPYDWRHHLAGDTGRMRAELGFAEPVPADEALKRTVVWEQQQVAPSEAGDYAAEDEALRRLESGLGGQKTSDDIHTARYE